MDELRQRLTLILQGLQFAGQISYIIKSVTNLHILLKVTMHKKCLLSICKLIEFLKLISLVFKRNVNFIVDTNACITQYLQYQLLLIIASNKVCIYFNYLNFNYNNRNLFNRKKYHKMHHTMKEI